MFSEVSLIIDVPTDDAIYQSLNTSPSEITLLEILRLEVDQPVECRLHTVSLDDNSTFATLSYVWGDSFVTRTIIVNGRIKSVKTNLEEALRHVKPH